MVWEENDEYDEYDEYDEDEERRKDKLFMKGIVSTLGVVGWEKNDDDDDDELFVGGLISMLWLMMCETVIFAWVPSQGVLFNDMVGDQVKCVTIKITVIMVLLWLISKVVKCARSTFCNKKKNDVYMYNGG